MKIYDNLYQQFYSYENLEYAFKKARKHKTKKDYVIKFENSLKENLLQLRNELIFHIYQPRPLETFIIRDSKTRKISKSDFRDRVIHHALVNILEPIFDKFFIYDSYANRKNKGTLKAVKRFDYFKIKVSKNNTKNCFILKADIKHYFETVSHDILILILRKKIYDKKVIWLIKKILLNDNTKEIGIPLGNLTSQFFANVYLNELDYFVKHKLKAKYYIRYVDDFVILHSSKKQLFEWKEKINKFLKENLKIELHPDKSKIILLNRGPPFLGFRIFNYHKLLKKKNIRNFKRKLKLFSKDKIDYDKIYESLQGYFAYMKHADTYNLRKELIKKIQKYFPNQISSTEINRWIKLQKSSLFNLIISSHF